MKKRCVNSEAAPKDGMAGLTTLRVGKSRDGRGCFASKTGEDGMFVRIKGGRLAADSGSRFAQAILALAADRIQVRSKRFLGEENHMASLLSTYRGKKHGISHSMGASRLGGLSSWNLTRQGRLSVSAESVDERRECDAYILQSR